MTATPRPADRRDTTGWGVILIAVGLGTLALQLFPGSGAVILLAIGLGLLVLFAIDRRYGALIPGSIMTGLGAGILAVQNAGWVLWAKALLERRSRHLRAAPRNPTSEPEEQARRSAR